MRSLLRVLLCAILFVAQSQPQIIIIAKKKAGGAASITYVQSNSTDSDADATTVAVTLTSVGSGNLIACWVVHFLAATTISVSDGTSSLTARTYVSETDANGQWFYLLSANGGTKTYTATLGASRSYRSIHCWEYSYTGTIAFDQESTNHTTGTTSVTSGNITTTAAVSVALAGYADPYLDTPTSKQINGLAASHTIEDATGIAESWDRIFASTFTGQATATAPTTTTWLCALVAFKAT